MKKDMNYLFFLSLILLLFTFSCQQVKEEPILEYSSDIEWLEEQGYAPLDESYEHYDYVISLLENPNQATPRADFCKWRHRPQNVFACDSQSGGNCQVFVQTGASTLTACIVCVGGNDNGNSDCF